MRRLGGWRRARRQPAAAGLQTGSGGDASAKSHNLYAMPAPAHSPPPRTCSGCSSCCACLSDTRSHREGCARPVSLSLMPDTSLTFLAISLMSVSSFLILLE